MNRRRILGLALAVMAFPPPLHAQPARPKYRIGILHPPIAATGRALVEGLRERGYVEGTHYVLETRSDGGDLTRLPQLAKELVATRPDVMVTASAPRIEALARETSTIPIVMASVGDAVEQGFAKSLRAPGGNLTGISTQNAEVTQKLFDLARDILPAAAHVSLIVDDEHAAYNLYKRDLETVARRAGARHTLAGFKRSATLESLFEEIAKQRPDVLIAAPSVRLIAMRSKLAALALKARLPLFATFSEYAEAGCLATYSANLAEQFRRAADFVVRILGGQKPAAIPIEQPTIFELVINMKSAKQLGIIIPQTVLFRADRVIE